MNGSGCKSCPVKPCETMNYRGSTCSAQRAKYGLGDPMTNADRLRAMSDEELAAWLFDFDCDAVAIGLMQMEQGLMTKEERLEWLQQPAEGE